MKKRNARVRDLLGIFMPLAHAVGDGLERGPEMRQLLSLLYEILCYRDREALEALLETLRADGLLNLWQFVWDRAVAMACTKNFQDRYHCVLLAIPFDAPWSGECRAVERNALTRVLKKQGVIPRRGKIYWFPKPQSLHRLRDANPVDLWNLNTPGAKQPRSWASAHATVPALYLLVGRLEFLEQAPHWPPPETLLQAQAEALGWSPDTLAPCAPLRWYLQTKDPENTPEDRLMEMVFAAATAASDRVEALQLRAEDCKIQIEDDPEEILHVSLHPRGQSRYPLCGLDYASAGVSRDQAVEKLKQVLKEVGFAVTIGGSLDRPGVTLH